MRRNFSHKPTDDQELAIGRCAEFLLSRNRYSLLLLKGYAGTGKTSLVAALVRTMTQTHQKVCMLAPTGRAAKLLSVYAGMPAYTIHKRIYRQKSLADMDTFQINTNLSKNTLFIVDEASMIADGGGGGVKFGTGRLLDDLMQFVYSCDGCRLMLVGDTAQLPPVGEEQSPAMDAGVLEGYGMDVSEVCLTQVVRQAEKSGILWNATMLRAMLSADEVYDFPKLRVNTFADVSVLTGGELIDALEDSYGRCGVDGTIVVTRSNKRAGIFNNGIRTRLLDFEEQLCRGDLVMVAKNNYYWLGEEEDSHSAHDKENRDAGECFIANGDAARVLRIRNVREVYGFTFGDVTLSFPDYADREVEATAILDTLWSEAPALTKAQQDHLFHSVWDDYPEITNKRDRMVKLREDVLYNALQIKYAYAVTCHKAQGGQWQHVYIDQGYMREEMLSSDYFRWLYTALTRATEKVYLVNWPETQCES